jgi:tripartite-type tricarboxylate transporter receptor subunit TctC
MRRSEFIVLLVGAVATWPLVGHAQNSLVGYPYHPVTLIVPYAPGGGNDALARAVAEPIGKLLGPSHW